jgi:hypothetical protein
VSKIAACSADKKRIRICCRTVAVALTVGETFKGTEARYVNEEYARLNLLHAQAARGATAPLKGSK